MHVGQDGQLQLAAHFIKDLEASVDADAALAGAGGAVGLVERALVDQRNAQRRAGFLELACDVERHFQAFNGASARDQEKALVQANVESAQLHA
ncbi:hypothetical protein D3C71_717490 [compost metagenome]